MYMDGFQKIILYGAIIALIIALVVIGSILSKSKDKNWPPMSTSCPDWWIMDGSGNNAKCINVKDLGTCPPTGGSKHLTMDFNSPAFTGSNGDCSKYTWATNCGVSWDGITYGVNNPCSTST